MKNFALFPAAAIALLASGSVAAETLLEDIAVTAEVTAACTGLTATDVDFGSAAAADVDDDATSTITVTCDTGTQYTVELDYGLTPAGTQRQVESATPGVRMDYDIFQPGGFTVPWGLVVDGTQYDGTGTGAADPLTANFRLHRSSGAEPGVYTDLVGVTLTF